MLPYQVYLEVWDNKTKLTEKYDVRYGALIFFKVWPL